MNPPLLLRLTAWALAIAATASASGQQAPPAETAPAEGGVKFTVGQVVENRPLQSTGLLSVTFTVTGFSAGPVAILRQVRVTKAVDDQGRNLVSAARGTAASGVVLSLNTSSAIAAAARGGGSPRMSGSLQLRTSPRDAESIKLIEGEIEVFAPSEQNGGMIRIPEFQSLAGKTLQHEALQRNDIELTLHTPESLAALKAVTPALATRNPNFSAGPVFYIKDPGGRLASILFQDAAGKYLPTMGTAQMGNNVLSEFRFSSPPPPDMQMIAVLIAPGSTVNIPLRLENIPLP